MPRWISILMRKLERPRTSRFSRISSYPVTGLRPVTRRSSSLAPPTDAFPLPFSEPMLAELAGKIEGAIPPAGLDLLPRRLFRALVENPLSFSSGDPCTEKRTSGLSLERSDE
ncbi:hypothetical protein KM043_005973 [Ampulex compressa]|nr:hypothetical protein KM043_005973 [Ampulex compressa]